MSPTNFITLKNIMNYGPIPIGEWTSNFQNLGYLADGVTPEFPEGIYYYMVTEEFPFFSRCLKGDF